VRGGNAGGNAWCAVSLKIGTEVTGILTVAHDTEKNYTEREIFLLKSVANQLAVLIENHELYERMKEKNRELKRSKDSLKKHLKLLRHANSELTRLNETKTKFIGLASHELKTPITSIYGGVQFLLRYSGLELNLEQREILTSVCDGVSRIKHLVDDLLSISRIEIGGAPIRKMPVRLIPIFEEVYRGLILSMAGRSLQVEFIPEETPVAVNECLMRMVARNLLENAIKFTPDSGRIVVSGRVASRLEILKSKRTLHIFYPRLLQAIAGCDNFYRLDVLDTGIGIPEDELTRVFDKFYGVGDITYHTSSGTEFMSKGAGLGLSIVRGVVGEHHGLVWAAPGQDGIGTVFSILLPLE